VLLGDEAGFIDRSDQAAGGPSPARVSEQQEGGLSRSIGSVSVGATEEHQRLEGIVAVTQDWQAKEQGPLEFVGGISRPQGDHFLESTVGRVFALHHPASLTPSPQLRVDRRA